MMNSTHPWTRKKIVPIALENHSRITPVKRKNFSVEEITLLKRLIQKYRPYQIENKKTDSVNLGEKQRIWESITKEFNTHFPHGEATSVKQLRKLWDNLKTRRKNELLRERLVVEDESVLGELNYNAYDLNPVKDEVSDSLDSNTMSVDYPSTADESSFMNGNSSHNWTLPIETVIVEDDDTYRDLPNEDEESEQERSFVGNNLNNAQEKCQCNQTKKESELKEMKLKLMLREEEELYKMKKDEQLLKNEIANVQLRIIKEKKAYLAKKRKLQLQILSKQLDTVGRSEVNGGNVRASNSMKTEDEDGEELNDDAVTNHNNCNSVDADKIHCV